MTLRWPPDDRIFAPREFGATIGNITIGTIKRCQQSTRRSTGNASVTSKFHLAVQKLPADSRFFTK
jgi:hypothetical protein